MTQAPLLLARVAYLRAYHSGDRHEGVVTARYLLSTKLPLAYVGGENPTYAGDGNFCFFFTISTFKEHYVQARLDLPSACCEADLEFNARGVPIFCDKCNQAYNLASPVGTTLYDANAADCSPKVGGGDGELPFTLDEWLSLRTTLSPLERVLTVADLVANLEAFVEAYFAAMSSVRVHPDASVEDYKAVSTYAASNALAALTRAHKA